MGPLLMNFQMHQEKLFQKNPFQYWELNIDAQITVKVFILNLPSLLPSALIC